MKWKTVRVFVSSTFRDMHAERDHLIKVVFPRLREKLEQYKVYLIDIDLRWGITQEQADNDQVLELCLEQIDKCRPFFVGILGQRYGFVPSQFSLDDQTKFGWLQHHTGKSITELEILHGILNNPKMHGHAFFYFRTSESLEDIPEDIKREVYLDIDPTLVNNLEKLKDRICASDFPVESYSAKWDQNTFDRPTKRYGRLVGLDDFGIKLEEQLWDAIKDELELPEEPLLDTEDNPENTEQDHHDRFIDSHLRFYVQRSKVQRELIDKIRKNNLRPIIITGMSGSGKSAIMSWLCREYKLVDSETYVIPHFVGASAQSTN